MSASCYWVSPELRHSLWTTGVGRHRKGVGTRHTHAEVPPDRPFCRSFVFRRRTPLRKSWTLSEAQRGVAAVLRVWSEVPPRAGPLVVWLMPALQSFIKKQNWPALCSDLRAEKAKPKARRTFWRRLPDRAAGARGGSPAHCCRFSMWASVGSGPTGHGGGGASQPTGGSTA